MIKQLIKQSNKNSVKRDVLPGQSHRELGGAQGRWLDGWWESRRGAKGEVVPANLGWGSVWRTKEAAH